MKRIIIVFMFLIALFVSGCSNKKVEVSNSTNNISNDQDTTDNNQKNNESENDKRMILLIDNVEVEIEWVNNNSVNDLKELAKNNLIINMSNSGGFEQYGPIGKSITSNDSRITANYGDVILYSSSYLCIMYGSNTWSYTKVGHINMSQSELKELLNKPNVVVTLKME
ncbi:MAG: hypothetical protein IJM36_06265 [Acholeplasmatales bacterium]|nr:hypothetical protein [Acholeplasmatales bacterium]